MTYLNSIKRALRGTVVHSAYRMARNYWHYDRPIWSSQAKSERYDRETIEVMRRVLRADSLCVDAGANEGVILESMVSLAPDARHHAFEPLPDLAVKLRTRFPATRVHDCALSDAPGQSSFVYVVNDPAYSGLRRRVYDRPDVVTQELTVRVERMDDVIPASERVAFIKIDVEGGEYHLLRGATETIRRGQPVIVFEASANSTGQYGVTARAMYELFTSLEYDVSTMRRWLKGARPLTVDEYRWTDSGDFYFIATPRPSLRESASPTRSRPAH